MNRVELLEVWAKLLRASSTQIEKLLMRAPYQYKHYTIPKRTGGLRHIYHPTPNLKVVQRWLIANVFESLPVHDSVFSYRQGRNIKLHAAEHLHSNFLLRLDFSDFFPSIDEVWIEQYFQKQRMLGYLHVDSDVIKDIVRLCCRFDKTSRSMALSIGAPSSPLISNAILFDMDQAAYNKCLAMDCIYTRYADDIYISSKNKNILIDVEKNVREIFTELAPNLKFNENKTINLSKKFHRTVTGVTLTTDRQLSVGRELKRKIKTEIFLWINGKLALDKLPNLCGLISFVCDIEPKFYDSLCKKFDKNSIDRLYHNSIRKEQWRF